jgi:hypothetical protein
MSNLLITFCFLKCNKIVGTQFFSKVNYVTLSSNTVFQHVSLKFHGIFY